MIQEIKAIQSVASIALTLLKESTLSKLAKGDLKIALETFKQIHTEANPEAGLNRALCQFELAYQHQVDSIDRWKFWQADKKHWPEYTTANKICVYIALINYILGNRVNAKYWLLNKMHIEGNYEVLPNIKTWPDSIAFYRDVLQESYNEFYYKVIVPADERAESKTWTAEDCKEFIENHWYI